MVGVKVEHVLILAIVAFVLYHLVSRCGCTNGLVDGFSVGIETSSTIPSNCTTTLNNLCSASRQEGSEKCGLCASSHQHKLLMAGCTASMVDSFCSNSCHFGEKCFVKGDSNTSLEKTGCKNMKNASDCEKAWACVYGYEDNKEVCNLNKGNICVWNGNKCVIAGNTYPTTNCSLENECPESLPDCPRGQNTFSNVFTYNPDCKFDYGVDMKETYMFDGEKYYICDGVNERGQKCKPSEGQKIPICNTALADQEKCTSMQINSDTCNERFEWYKYLGKENVKINCTNHGYNNRACRTMKDSGIPDPTCVKDNCKGLAGPNRQNYGIENYCYTK
tara:strand:+ start:1223 stop:2221 length:999 start_codon:yes stop_codon:yes gene_type:complete